VALYLSSQLVGDIFEFSIAGPVAPKRILGGNNSINRDRDLGLYRINIDGPDREFVTLPRFLIIIWSRNYHHISLFHCQNCLQS
jgi:hypothetical protein